MGLLYHQMLFLHSAHLYLLIVDAMLVEFKSAHLIWKTLLFHLQWKTSLLKVYASSVSAWLGFLLHDCVVFSKLLWQYVKEIGFLHLQCLLHVLL